MEIKRDRYLNRLIDRMHNGMVKVVTGIRRCGKTYLLFNLFGDYLRSEGVGDGHIIEELRSTSRERRAPPDRRALSTYACARKSRVGASSTMFFSTEVQYAIS